MRRGEIAEAAREGAVVIVPMGAIEQHGPHLPLNTDIYDALAIAQRAAELVEEFPVLVAPPIWWGLSNEHMDLPGTINVRLETLTAVVSDVCHSIHAHGFDKIVLLSGHGGTLYCKATTPTASSTKSCSSATAETRAYCWYWFHVYRSRACPWRA
jgi:creatinine amidohydrolase/Fe(II)-dependent formamide hydrolase-like protein